MSIDSRCPKCGNETDTPMHELGCAKQNPTALELLDEYARAVSTHPSVSCVNALRGFDPQEARYALLYLKARELGMALVSMKSNGPTTVVAECVYKGFDFFGEGKDYREALVRAAVDAGLLDKKELGI